jgi:hypothetical protein
VTLRNLALLHPDGSLTVYPPHVGIEQARREAIDFDENQDHPARLTKIVSLRIDDVELVEVPGLAPVQKTRSPATEI